MNPGDYKYNFAQFIYDRRGGVGHPKKIYVHGLTRCRNKYDILKYQTLLDLFTNF